MGKLILVIEDENEIRKDIVRTLQLSRYDTIDAPNGIEGLKLAMEFKPDLIISDIMMPGLDGYGLLKELQSHTDLASIPFLFLSAKSSRNDIREGMNLGADDFITKPFDIDDLLIAVEARLKKKNVNETVYNRKIEDLRSSLRRSIPHEIRTPLNIILGFSEYLKKNYINTNNDDATEMLSNIYDAGKRLQRLFENYLIYANLEIIATNPKDIANLMLKKTGLPENYIKEIVMKLADDADRSYDIEFDLSDAALLISEDYFTKIIEEIADNCIKFSIKGSKIKIRSVIENGWYIIYFTDFGRGMTIEQIQNIGAYIQFERKVYEQQGTGLGIAIVKRIIELHKGLFEIQSQPEQYTTIVIKLLIHKK